MKINLDPCGFFKPKGKLSDYIKEYEKYEFCKDVDCEGLKEGVCGYKGCIKSAKDLHKWVKSNDFYIIKFLIDGIK